MLKRFARKVVLNFRHTKSDRVASSSYSHYHQRIKRIWTSAVGPFKKINK